MARDPPRKIRGFVHSNYLRKSWSISIFEGYFLWFLGVLAISWQGDFMFSILKSTRLNIEIALLSLISLTRRKLKIVTFSVNLVWIIKAELRFDQFLKQCVFEDTKGKFRNLDPGSVWQISLVRRDRKWSKKSRFVCEFYDLIKLLLVNLICYFYENVTECLRNGWPKRGSKTHCHQSTRNCGCWRWSQSIQSSDLAGFVVLQNVNVTIHMSSLTSRSGRCQSW